MGPEASGALDAAGAATELEPVDTGLDPVGSGSEQATALSETRASARRDAGERMGTSGTIER